MSFKDFLEYKRDLTNDKSRDIMMNLITNQNC